MLILASFTGKMSHNYGSAQFIDQNQNQFVPPTVMLKTDTKHNYELPRKQPGIKNINYKGN